MMARYGKRIFDRESLTDSMGVIANPAPQPENLQSLFNNQDNVVNFANVNKNQVDPATYYNALGGNDTVYLPKDQAKADELAYNTKKFFFGATGNDQITGGQFLNDLIDGGDGNDYVHGSDGDDTLLGGKDHDQLWGGEGKDLIYAGIGIDYVNGGAGDDVIIANEDDEPLNDPQESVVHPTLPNIDISEDWIYGGDGNDAIAACSSDIVDGGDGNDLVLLSSFTDAPGVSTGGVEGGRGDDVVIGSVSDDYVATGLGLLFWPQSIWNEEMQKQHGGFHDVVNTGDGNDSVTTMVYCTAEVSTGAGNDTVFSLGLLDKIDMGRGYDELNLFGGACIADLGAGDDLLVVSRPAYDNPNTSQITLAEGADKIWFHLDEWVSNGDQQSLDKAPLILDFDTDEDSIEWLFLHNADFPELSLKPENIKAIAIDGGSALVYDDPVNNSLDFCLAKFQGVGADALQANFDQNAMFQ
jgi:Ca2+-binding RTX toxin-like protein